MEQVALFLLGYPLSVLANLSTVFIQSYFKKSDYHPLKSLFTDSFIAALEQKKSELDEMGGIGGAIIDDCIKTIKSNPDLLFQIISECLAKSGKDLQSFRSKKFKAELTSSIMSHFDFPHISIAQGLITSSLHLYESAFYGSMSTEDGVKYLIELNLKSSNSALRKQDLSDLKEQIIQEVSLNTREEMSSIKELFVKELSYPINNNIDTDLKNNFKELKTHIDELTIEQFNILHFISYKHRVIISGCAGSGKTLVAAEKAIRLHKAGIRTLFLTRSPFQAAYVRTLIHPNDIVVQDFGSMISEILNQEPTSMNDWNEYQEPTNLELERTFDRIDRQKDSYEYEAIIIDEGQDFKEDWWIIIESMSLNSRSQILYIFHDDHQSMSTFESKYPIQKSPFNLSKNCRNAGSIFSVVRKFHQNAPIVSALLKGHGHFDTTVFQFKDHLSPLVEIIDALQKDNLVERLTIITNEPGVKKSILNGANLLLVNDNNWRKNILHELTEIRNEIKQNLDDLRYNPLGQSHDLRLARINFHKIELPSISNERYPTKDDILAVSKYSKEIRKFSKYIHKDRRRTKLGFRSTVKFYESLDWARKLLKPRELVISADQKKTQKSQNVIPLKTIEMIKGLETDVAILFINSMNKDIVKELYIGSSRAVGQLHLLIENNVYQKIVRLME